METKPVVIAAEWAFDMHGNDVFQMQKYYVHLTLGPRIARVTGALSATAATEAKVDLRSMIERRVEEELDVFITDELTRPHLTAIEGGPQQLNLELAA